MSRCVDLSDELVTDRLVFADKCLLAPLAEPEKIVPQLSAALLDEELSPESREEWLTAAEGTEDGDIGWHVTDVPPFDALKCGQVVLAPNLVKADKDATHLCVVINTKDHLFDAEQLIVLGLTTRIWYEAHLPLVIGDYRYRPSEEFLRFNSAMFD